MCIRDRRCIHPVAAQKSPSSTSVLPAAETRCRWPDPSTTRLQLSASDTPFVVDATGPTYEKGGYDYAGGGLFGPSWCLAHRTADGHWLIAGAGTAPVSYTHLRAHET